MIWNSEHDIAQWRMTSDKLANIVAIWDTDDELSSDKVSPVMQSSSSISSAAGALNQLPSFSESLVIKINQVV